MARMKMKMTDLSGVKTKARKRRVARLLGARRKGRRR
jgi:hypothetical protein